MRKSSEFKDCFTAPCAPTYGFSEGNNQLCQATTETNIMEMAMGIHQPTVTLLGLREVEPHDFNHFSRILNSNVHSFIYRASIKHQLWHYSSDFSSSHRYPSTGLLQELGHVAVTELFKECSTMRICLELSLLTYTLGVLQVCGLPASESPVLEK